jgi:hypothetical protein
LYIVSVAALLFSGIGQMPIFKRYYLADLPGLAWTADFMITLVIHYIAAAVFLALVSYYLVTRLMTRSLSPIGRKGGIRGVLFGLLILSGVVLVFRNLPAPILPPGLIVGATFTHVAAAMLFLLAAVTVLRFGKK